MSTTDRTRFWDRNWNLLYDSLSATQTPEEFIREHDWLNCTVDHADGHRWIGRWINNNGDIEKCCEDEYLTQIMTLPNPLLAEIARQNEVWAIPDDPFDTSAWQMSVGNWHLPDALPPGMTIDPEPPRADGRPHPPRPTTTPPMWANNPNQQRRRR